jgi:phosphoglycerate dehydrogenase-like enzyme
VIVTPHTSPVTDGFRRRMVDFWCDQLRRFAEGEPLRGVVDRRAGY